MRNNRIILAGIGCCTLSLFYFTNTKSIMDKCLGLFFGVTGLYTILMGSGVVFPDNLDEILQLGNEIQAPDHGDREKPLKEAREFQQRILAEIKNGESKSVLAEKNLRKDITNSLSKITGELEHRCMISLEEFDWSELNLDKPEKNILKEESKAKEDATKFCLLEYNQTQSQHQNKSHNLFSSFFCSKRNKRQDTPKQEEKLYYLFNLNELALYLKNPQIYFGNPCLPNYVLLKNITQIIPINKTFKKIYSEVYQSKNNILDFDEKDSSQIKKNL